MTNEQFVSTLVYTHSQTNRHLHLCPARPGLWKFGFVGALALKGRVDFWPGQRLSQWAKCECRAWCSLLRKVNLFTDILPGFTFNNGVLRLPAIVLLNTTFSIKRLQEDEELRCWKLTFHREVRDPLFDVCTPHISPKGPQLQFDRDVQTSFQNKLISQDPQENEKKRRYRHRVYGLRPPYGNFKWSSMLFFSLSKPSQSDEDGPCHPTVQISNFKGKKTSAPTLNFYYQEYIRTRVCNTTHSGLARRNFK